MESPIKVSQGFGLALSGVAAAATATAGLWALAQPTAPSAEMDWVPALDLTLRITVGPLAAVMTVLIGGIGAAVVVYARGYFGPDTPGMGRFVATLTAFGASMTGLVVADSVWMLFICWELTTVTSFLLVGHKSTSSAARTAARRALVITAGGGLVLLAGLLLLADATGTSVLSEMGPVNGASGSLAAVLIVVAAATKSALVPFHIWLPGAMAAPTPVSAYLHSATMVKAGVLLVAVVAPVLGAQPVWTPLALAFGVAAMLWGAVGALRHADAKLILAWGTVSQLGLMVTLLALGDPKATFAGIAMLVAHAVFKAALFMVVGEVDVRTGTRDIRRLGGLAREMPVAAATAVLAGLSMAGVPPLLGFATKEAAVEAVLGLDGQVGWLVGSAVIVGAMMTVAYTTRLVTALFAGSKPADVVITPPRNLMTIPAGVLALAGLAGFAGLGWVSEQVAAAAGRVDPAASTYALLRWPGLTAGLLTSLVVVVTGAAWGAWSVRRLRGGHLAAVPRDVGAGLLDDGLDAIPRVARRIAGVVQHGSLPLYLATMALTAAVAATPFLEGLDLAAMRPWDSPAQAAVAALTVAAAVGVTVLGTRLGAALALGAVGVGVTGLFVVHGAPDLALTQLLVETVVVVAFVGHLGRLASRFQTTRDGWRRARLAVSLAVGGAVAVALMAAGSAPSGTSPTDEIVTQAVEEGGGANVVNVILTDLRALDTLGEIVVLVVVAMGLLALGRSGATRSGASNSVDGQATQEGANVLARQGVGLVTPLALVLAAFLFFAGHNQPGGGFAAGLVLGALVALRRTVFLSAPRDPLKLLAGGGIVAAVTALVPLLAGGTLLDQVVLTVELPLFGSVKSGTALLFDAGVTMIVVGVVVAVLDGMAPPSQEVVEA